MLNLLGSEVDAADDAAVVDEDIVGQLADAKALHEVGVPRAEIAELRPAQGVGMDGGEPLMAVAIEGDAHEGEAVFFLADLLLGFIEGTQGTGLGTALGAPRGPEVEQDGLLGVGETVGDHACGVGQGEGGDVSAYGDAGVLAGIVVETGDEGVVAHQGGKLAQGFVGSGILDGGAGGVEVADDIDAAGFGGVTAEVAEHQGAELGGVGLQGFGTAEQGVDGIVDGAAHGEAIGAACDAELGTTLQIEGVLTAIGGVEHGLGEGVYRDIGLETAIYHGDGVYVGVEVIGSPEEEGIMR